MHEIKLHYQLPPLDKRRQGTSLVFSQTSGSDGRT